VVTLGELLIEERKEKILRAKQERDIKDWEAENRIDPVARLELLEETFLKFASRENVELGRIRFDVNARDYTYPRDLIKDLEFLCDKYEHLGFVLWSGMFPMKTATFKDIYLVKKHHMNTVFHNDKISTACAKDMHGKCNIKLYYNCECYCHSIRKSKKVAVKESINQFIERKKEQKVEYHRDLYIPSYLCKECNRKFMPYYETVQYGKKVTHSNPQYYGKCSQCDVENIWLYSLEKEWK
jgi:hypothetical protein